MRRLVTVAMGAFLCIEAIALGARLVNSSAAYDDAFITFRYARNFADGQGLVYNPGEEHLGTTAPAYALGLGLLTRLSGRWDPALLANWLSAFAIALAAWYAFRLALIDFGLAAGVSAGLSVALNPMLISVWGGEWLLAMAAMAAGFYYYRADRVVPAAVALSLAVLLRSEAAIGVAIVFADAVFRGKPGAWKGIAVSAVIGLAWVVIASIVIGHVVPSTLATKLAHARSNLFGTVLRGFISGSRQFLLADPRMITVALLAWHGALLAIVKGGVWRLVGLWIAAHFAFYVWLHMPFYHWYLVPVGFGISLAAGVGVPAVMLYVRALVSSRAVARVVAGTICVVLVGGMVVAEARSSQAWIRAKPDPRERMYNRVGAWLADQTPSDASVCYLEIGRIGYFSRRQLVDLMGLVTPGVAEHVANQDLLWAVYRYQPDYYLVGSTFTWAGSVVREPWFPGAYQEVHEFGAPDLDMKVTVYRKLPGAALPDPPVVEGVQLRPDAIVGEMLAGTSHGQTFVPDHDNLSAVAVILATYARTNRGTMALKLEQIDPARVLYETQFPMEDVGNNEWRVFSFPPAGQTKGKTLRVTLTALDAVPGNALTLYYNPRDAYAGGTRLVNGQSAGGDLTLKLFYPAGS